MNDNVLFFGFILVWISLIILKALGDLTWSWLAVLLFPVWLPILIAIAIMCCIFIALVFFLVAVVILAMLGVE